MNGQIKDYNNLTIPESKREDFLHDVRQVADQAGLFAIRHMRVYDQKFDLFKEKLENEFFDSRNLSGKLVVFSESVDTLNYLKVRLENELGRTDVLTVTAENRDRRATDIKENFDANSTVKKDRYNIILTSDVLAEGVNLHRSHIIVNYDSPWNASRLMQRIGRVNRIGSVAEFIYNYTSVS